jgi:putative acetyltransferase
LLRLREEFDGDREAVKRLHREAFEDDGTVADLVHTLRQLVRTEDGLSLVAELDGQVAGHVMFTRSLLDAPPRPVDVQVLSPLAVLARHQRQGVGSALVWMTGTLVYADAFLRHDVVGLRGDGQFGQ